MKVFVLEEGFPYEGTWLLGVFSTREKAQEMLDTGITHHRGADYTITEVEIDVLL